MPETHFEPQSDPKLFKDLNLLLGALHLELSFDFDILFCESLIELIKSGNFDLALELGDLPKTTLHKSV
jgi:hypothetical protein